MTRAIGKTGLIESDVAPSIITVTSADESDVDITEAVEKATGTIKLNFIHLISYLSSSLPQIV